MFNQINIKKIIDDHFKTIINPTLLICTLLFSSFFITFVTKPINKDLINVLITAYSIFVGLMFNLLLLVFDIIKNLKDCNSIYDDNGNKIQSRVDLLNLKKEFTKEIYKNISFAILMSISLVVLLMFYSLSPKFNFHQFISVDDLKNIIKFSLTWIVYFMSSLFLYTLYLILKRIHFLLIKETD